MNFIINAFKAEESRDRILGVLLTELSKISNYKKFNNDVIEGIILNKKIKTLAIEHPRMHTSMNRLRMKNKKNNFAIIEVFFDHFLAKNWESFSNEPYDIFAAKIHNVLIKNLATLPNSTIAKFPEILSKSWLDNYKTIEGVHTIIRKLTHTSRVGVNSEESIFDLMENYSSFQNDFMFFMKDMEKETPINFEITDLQQKIYA
ncbi:MAG: acyl carrier protein phosphodiesterase [Sporocytophaga sp.]|uniref:acyl carrier protein phosphodiesterase n=1 Tax=Sporocytophaga sp. TaxID=2231183 RepID=UPI001B10F40A|nr:acyl carrier protein phosphodiesterase [Sporocytophaga sp.]MBO9700422.1 acyl carrier protein phosphodiesterase [Sporocytophaga sp.]